MQTVIDRHVELDFYRQQSEISSPGRYVSFFDDLPTDIGELCQVVQNIFLHQFWILDEGNYGIGIRDLKSAGRDLNAEINQRGVEESLDFLSKMDADPLSVPRDAAAKVVGNCRHYALMLVAMLRHQGVPARMRSGVARYFMPAEGMLEDHFITEFWNDGEKRWQRVDPQLDGLQRRVLGIHFDPIDMPLGQFLDAGESYLELKSARTKEEKIGIFDFRGWKYVWYKIFSDLACVNNVEVLPWEEWGICTRIGNESFNQQDEDLLAKIAELLAGMNSVPENFSKLVQIYATNPDFKIPVVYQPYFFELPPFK